MTAGDLPVSFVDTNVLVYALAADDVRRSPVAQKLLRELMTAQVFKTSTQVLQELFVTLTRKVRTPMTAEQALRYLDQIAAWPVVVLDYGGVREAIELSSRRPCRYGMRSSSLPPQIRSKRLYTEDLQDGPMILGVEVVNPSASEPASGNPELSRHCPPGGILCSSL